MFQIVEDVCKDDNLKQLAKEVDVIFTATPQGFLAGVLDEEILSNTKVIDLSADFRSRTLLLMKSGMESNINLRSLFRKRFTVCVKETVRRSNRLVW